MNRTNATKLLLSNGLVALVAFLIWMITSGLDMTTVYGATRPIPYKYDRGVFNITDVSVKDDDYSSPSLIGFIENTDPLLNTIKGVTLKIEMFDRNNHLIDVADSGYSSLMDTFQPHDKSAFKVPIGKNNDLDHINIQILATDWGTSQTYPSGLENQSSNLPPASGPYIGIEGLDLTANLSKSMGLNQTKGILITNVTKYSPADDYGLPSYNGSIKLERGDIIQKIDNKTISNMGDMKVYVISKQIGDIVHLTILRDNATKELDLKLGAPRNLPLDYFS